MGTYRSKPIPADSVEDAYGITTFEEKESDTQMWKLLQGCTEPKADMIIWARAKTFWRSCRDSVAKSQTFSTVADLDAPLETVDSAELDKKYLDEYKIPMHIMLTPEDRLKSQVYREFKSKLHIF